MKLGERILALIFFLVIGLTGLALIGLGSWILIAPVQSAGPVDTLVFLTPTLAPSGEVPVIITATLEPSPTTAPTDAPVPTSAAAPAALPTATATQSALATWSPCPGVYPSQLHVGDKAMVSLEPPLPNNVRAQPDTTAKFLFAIQPGEVVKINDGPGCSNNWVWWQITTSDGRTGWTAEGDGTDYWLQPVK